MLLSSKAGSQRVSHGLHQLQQDGKRYPGTLGELQKLAGLFNMNVDQILNTDGDIPGEVTMEDKSSIEQLNLIKQLDEEDRTVILKIIDTMLTKKKFKDFFHKKCGETVKYKRGCLKRHPLSSSSI